MKALDEGFIKPRTNILPETKVNLRTTDVLLKRTGEMNLVRFPHRQHTAWLDCSNCHDHLFERKAGDQFQESPLRDAPQFTQVLHLRFEVVLCAVKPVAPVDCPVNTERSADRITKLRRFDPILLRKQFNPVRGAGRLYLNRKFASQVPDVHARVLGKHRRLKQNP